MPRLPFPDLSAASAEVRDTIGAMPFDMAVMRMFAHADGAFVQWLRLGGAIISRSSLDKDIQELAICVVTAADSPKYEYAYHRQVARTAGLTDEQIAAIERGDLRSAVFTPRQQVVATFAREVHHKVRASDETLADLRRHFTDRQVVELILSVGQYMLNSRVAENAGVTLEDDRLLAKPGQYIPETPNF